ncbi:hypothetical protein LPJ64_001734, partial [Coemansia asiatica]
LNLSEIARASFAECVNIANIADAAANKNAAFVNVERLSPELAVAAAFAGVKSERTMAPILIELLHKRTVPFDFKVISVKHIVAAALADAAYKRTVPTLVVLPLSKSFSVVVVVAVADAVTKCIGPVKAKELSTEAAITVVVALAAPAIAAVGVTAVVVPLTGAMSKRTMPACAKKLPSQPAAAITTAALPKIGAAYKCALSVNSGKRVTESKKPVSIQFTLRERSCYACRVKAFD